MRNDIIKPKIIAILGPTAVGKSQTAVELAHIIDAEIISADSMQIYKYFDIGTSKPTLEERNGIEHHLIDIIEPDEDYNAGKFRKSALNEIKEIQNKNKRIIVVGGTFLYLKVLLSGLIEELPVDAELRKELDEKNKEHGSIYLHNKLKQVDPLSSKKIHENDYIRIQRALEVYSLTGTRISEYQKAHAFSENKFNVYKIALNSERDEIKNTINERVDFMIKKGFVDEVENIRSMGYSKYLKPMKSIGYKEINQFIDSDIDLKSAVELIKRDTRRYAKRQITWLRSEKELNWYDPEKDKEKLINDTKSFYGL